MVKPEDFLSHAGDLVRDGTEIGARRAVSAAYYGVFHSLALSGATMMAAGNALLASETARAFEHSTMLKVCREYALPANKEAYDLGLILVAKTFVDLQAARHEADYDLAANVSQIRARMLVGLATAVMFDWPYQASTETGRTFLLRLLLGPRLGRRG